MRHSHWQRGSCCWIGVALLAFAAGSPAQERKNGDSTAPTPATAPPANPTPAPTAAAPRTISLTSAAARRNENVAVNRIDTEAAKEANIRLGVNVQPPPANNPELNYFAGELGRGAGETVVLRSQPALSGWHSTLLYSHQNSIFQARSFFQVGPVQPARTNQWSAQFSGDAGKLGLLSGTLGGRKVRGMVNGNVLVPLPGERVPLATDPAVRALVARWLQAYPNELANRPDFDIRALNRNAPQQIDELNANLRLDRKTWFDGRLSAFYAIDRQRTDAFQLVAGQNPDMRLHSHRARLAWRKSLSAGSELSAGFGFTRAASLLAPEPLAVGPRVRIGYQIEELGPDSHFPIDRAQNSFRGGAGLTRRAGRHAWQFGGEFTRFQLNGIETNNARGVFQFGNNFGRTAIENFLLGTATTYEATVGELDRGFRNWLGAAWIQDQWQATPALQLTVGVRYHFDTAPVEVRSRNVIPYNCDCNNFSPRFSIAWKLKGDTVLRTGYTVSFGQILPVTYQQIRINAPLVRYFVVQNPYLADPLRGLDLNNPNLRNSPTVLARELTSPYSHQYWLSFEKKLASNITARIGYVGSRTFKLLDTYQENRAVPVPGIPLTTATVDQRRPDPRYYDVRYVVNAGAAYLDAGQAALDWRARGGFTLSAAYTWAKAIDTGSDYTGTAANRDLISRRSQAQSPAQPDKRGLSAFDSPHSLLLGYAWDLPRSSAASQHRFTAWLVNGWQITGSTLIKTGTPLTLFVGSDAPGFGNVDGGASDRPNILAPEILGSTIDDPNTAPAILRRDRFGYIVPGDPRGSLGRNTFRKDGIINTNAALAKEWITSAAGREMRFVFRAETFNLTNHPQFDEPQRNLTSPSFGRITNTLNDGRAVQLTLRIVL